MRFYALQGPPQEACAVCGVPTKSRCSGCASAGGPAIFFCSPEHQKLVWHTHKLVCRDKSSRFITPPLSEEEFKRFQQFAEQPVFRRDGSQSDMRFAVYHESDPRLGLVEGEVNDRVIPSLTSFENHERQEQQSWLVRARGLSATFYQSASVRYEPDVRVHTVWEIVAWIVICLVRCLPEALYLTEKSARIQHCALIFATLLKTMAGSTPQGFDCEWLRISFDHLRAAIDAATNSREIDIYAKVLNAIASLASQVDCRLVYLAVPLP